MKSLLPKQLFILIFTGSVLIECFAVENIQISALLGTKAVVLVDGQQQLLAIGETSKEGIELVSVETDGVQLKIDGETAYYPLGSSTVATKYTERINSKEHIYKDVNGMFRTIGAINGIPVNFLVDTGASSVAMNSIIAKRVGINFLLDGEPTMVQTAQGVTKAWLVKLDRISVGDIELKNIEAGVLEGGYPTDVLLGMSFLGRLNVQHKGEVMMLEVKF